jgi:cellobiose phosphorylase
LDTATVPLQLKSGVEYEFFNGFGGFVNDGSEYEILLEGGIKPPVPWINVVANKKFGFQISESGGGFTWAYNSRENKITPWSNDPVTDRASEAIYILDETTGIIMTPMSLGKSDRGIYRIRHGIGYSTFLHEEEQLIQELTVFTPLEEPVKLWMLKLTNQSDKIRYLSLSYYVEWVIGTNREHTNSYIYTGYNKEQDYFYAKNLYTFNFEDNISFMFSSECINGYTGDRQEFLGNKGSVQNPRGADAQLSKNTGACYDSCGAIQTSIEIMPNESKTVLFALGQSNNRNEIKELRNKYKDITNASKELDKVRLYWDELLGIIKVKTNDRAVDLLVNKWLLYQTISCRLNAKTAFYQCGGAIGFRDQLQDTLALQLADPGALHRQILIACSRQFEEGDVQHWWHPPQGVGVRTKITDDLLWLPYAVAVYIRTTGDYSVLTEEVNYIKGALLDENKHEIMFTPETSEKSGSVYEHCRKTIQRTNFGRHGIPLMGGGDWNDGMNEVGIGGTGESVWLGWFFYKVLTEFIPLCYHERDVEYARELEQKKEELQKSIEENCWDGQWYLRAFYDDGSKLGSKDNDECMIDSISQSWSIISKAGSKEKTIKAMKSAWRYLVKEEEYMSLLLFPPFNKTEKNPGYIKNYLPGIRENGGQYTHAAVWLAIATAMMGDYNMAHKLFTMLNPIHITSNRRDALRYEKEPYVMIADISLSPPYTGRGGWSWYTGSAGWMYQGLVFWFLGIRKEADTLIIDPATPSGFGDYTIWYRYGTAEYEIRVENRSKGNLTTEALIVDGNKVLGNKLKLTDDGKIHLVTVI